MKSPRAWAVRIASLILLAASLLAQACAHYPLNDRLAHADPAYGYRARNIENPASSPDVLMGLAFSGGGTRAAAFSYGVLEVLRETVVTSGGKDRRLLDEVDFISGVSGGSFTAAYYGLFGDRIFKDYEERFLGQNIEGSLALRMTGPITMVRLLSPYFDRSDMAAEYYDEHLFDRATFKDLTKKKGPMIFINATDMVTGNRMAFNQDAFDMICSDLGTFPVARAVAASSAVPILLTPVSIKNYAGTCDYKLPEPAGSVLKNRDTTSRQFHTVNNMTPYLDSSKKRYIHLVDGGVSDNLGLRAVLDRALIMGDFATTLKNSGKENAHNVVFILVNAETEVEQGLSILDQPPAFSAMLASYSSIAITRYNFETIMLLQESFARWQEEVRESRCPEGQVDKRPGGCGDIEFFLIEVKFDALKDEAERSFLKQLPTSFSLTPEQVDILRATARRIMGESPEYARLLKRIGKQ